jgi:hypothetical protein
MGSSGGESGGAGAEELRVKYLDFVKGSWIERRYVSGEEKGRQEMFLYLGVFVPSEPMVAVWYDDLRDTLITEPVCALVARVRYREGLHYVEFIPVLHSCEGGVGFFEAYDHPAGTDMYLGVVPLRLFTEVREDLLAEGRREAKEWREKLERARAELQKREKAEG